jgi:hypothetical protein
MVHFGDREQACTGTKIETAFCESSLSAIESFWREKQRHQEDHGFEQAVNQPRIGVQYLVDCPLDPGGLPRPSAVEHEAKLLSASLCVFHNGAAYLRLDPKIFKLLGQAPCKNCK